MWAFDDVERELLSAATAALPTRSAVIARAVRRADVGGLWLVEATVDELDGLYSLVEALEGGTRSRRRLEQLEGLRATLCTSMDGF